MWFYACAIVYDPAALKGKVPGFAEQFVKWNPMSVYIHAIRNTTFDGRGPTALTFFAATAYAISSVLLGLVVFRKLDRRLAEEI